MRLPLRHAPPATDIAVQRCAYLEDLAGSAMGLPLGPAARQLSRKTSRGRHGNALEWHLGLTPQQNQAEPDWEGRIEIKLVSLWRNGAGQVVCDKQKVCDASYDPWQRLGNVLWVLADRLTRVVVDVKFWTLAGELRQWLASRADVDPHFGDPALWIETRESQRSSAPAYYLSPQVLQTWVIPGELIGVFPALGQGAEKRLPQVRDLRFVVLYDPSGAGEPTAECPHCRAKVSGSRAELDTYGFTRLRHEQDSRGCAAYTYVGLDGDRVCWPSGPFSQAEFVRALQDQLAPDEVFRLADRVPEPEDHLHGTAPS